MEIQLHIWHPYVVGTLQEGGGSHLAGETRGSPGANDPREGQQASEAPCCMLLSCLCPILSSRGCPGGVALPRKYYQ